MHRRSLLSRFGTAALAGVATTAGCVGMPVGGPSPNAPPGSTRGRPREVPMGTPVALGDRTLRFADARLRESVVPRSLTHDVLYTADAGQFLVADVAITGTGRPAYGPFEADAFDTTLVVDDDEHEPDDVLSGSQEVIFEVPATPADRAAVRVRFRGQPTAWVLDAATVARMDRVPEFAVRDARVETEGDEAVLVVRVANEGDRDGLFRGVVCAAHLADACRVFSVAVPEGGTATRRHSLGTFDDPRAVALVGDVTADARRFRYEGATPTTSLIGLRPVARPWTGGWSG